jgi:hypothetical protein
VKGVARFHIPIPKQREFEITRIQRGRLKDERTAQINMTDEEIVEDAGLEDDTPAEQASMRRKARKKAA